MVFNATFNTVLVISWLSFIGGENHWPVGSHWQPLSHIMLYHMYTSPRAGFKLTTLVAIGTGVNVRNTLKWYSRFCLSVLMSATLHIVTNKGRVNLSDSHDYHTCWERQCIHYFVATIFIIGRWTNIAHIAQASGNNKTDHAVVLILWYSW